MYLQAVLWYQRSADSGCARAQFELGRCCAQGLGVGADAALAVRWFREAAQQGHAGAQCAPWWLRPPLACIFCKGVIEGGAGDWILGWQCGRGKGGVLQD